MEVIASDYLLLCYLASMGVLQLVAAYSRLRGILFSQSTSRSIAIGLILIALGFARFFGSGPRLLSDTEDGLDGNQQALFFTMGAAAALATTFVLSSLFNHRRIVPCVTDTGLDTLREATYLQAIRHRIKELWKHSRKQTPRSYSGSTPA